MQTSAIQREHYRTDTGGNTLWYGGRYLSESTQISPLRRFHNGAERRVEDVDDGRLRSAVLQAVAYSDVFDYPLTEQEIHRYLEGVSASLELTRAFLRGGHNPSRCLSHVDGYYMLPGREHTREIRREREDMARRLWPAALRYGRLIAGLPFIRMVGITGELAVNNVSGQSDIDYFIVTEPERLWLARATVIVIVRAAARRGITVCPNFLVTENALEIDHRNLYTAREMAQMIPLSGPGIYNRIRETNEWVLDYLPNAAGPPAQCEVQVGKRRHQELAEWVLRSWIGDRLELWEMTRKIDRFTRESPEAGETAFSADWCKGHFDAHGEQTLSAYEERMRVVEELLK